MPFKGRRDKPRAGGHAAVRRFSQVPGVSRNTARLIALFQKRNPQIGKMIAQSPRVKTASQGKQLRDIVTLKEARRLETRQPRRRMLGEAEHQAKSALEFEHQFEQLPAMKRRGLTLKGMAI